MHVISVVPIFMSAGAAALPTLLAAITSVVAVLLKPRELLRACRNNPKTASASAAATALLIAGGLWWWLAPTAASAAHRHQASKYDWVAVAQRVLDGEGQGKVPTEIAAIQAADSASVLGHDYSRCAFSGGSSPRRLVPDWNFKPESTLFFASPNIVGDRVYAAGAVADVNEFNGVLYCLDAKTGTKLWEVTQAKDEFFHAFFSSPAVTKDGKFVVIGEGLHENRDCQLRCFDAGTGQFRWGIKTSLHIESSPAIFGDIAVVGCGAIEGTDGKATGDPGHVLAVRISDGKELWRQPVNDPESSPAIDDAGNVYIGSGFNGSEIVAMRSDSPESLKEKGLDRVLWKTPVAQPVTSAITLIGDLVIAGAGNSDFVYADPNPEGYVIAIDRKNGKIVWQTKFADAALGAIAARDGKLICPLRTGEVAALSLADGHVLWRTHVSGKAPVLAGCAFTGTLVYAVSDDGYIAVIDAADGKLLGKKVALNDQKVAGTGKSLSGPQVAGGRVIVGTETGGLRCFVGSRSSE